MRGSLRRKEHFACPAEPGVLARIGASGRSQLVLAGMEAHVCVMQSAIALAAHGRPVFVVADAISSRRPADADVATRRMQSSGVALVSSEMTLFEWAHRAATPAFRELHRRFLKEQETVDSGR